MFGPKRNTWPASPGLICPSRVWSGRYSTRFRHSIVISVAGVFRSGLPVSFAIDALHALWPDGCDAEAWITPPEFVVSWDESGAVGTPSAAIVVSLPQNFDPAHPEESARASAATAALSGTGCPTAGPPWPWVGRSPRPA